MKSQLLIILLFSGLNVCGQYKIDPLVQSEFDSLFNIQPKDIQKKRYIRGFDQGITFVIYVKADTLNIIDYQPKSIDTSSHTVTEIVIDPQTGKEMTKVPKDTIKYNQWFTCNATYVKDTLVIGSFFGLFSGHGFSLKIINNKCIGEYFEFAQGEPQYRNNLNDIKSTELFVNAMPKDVVLSRLPKNLGNTFYGKATIVTEPFYYDNEYFKNGFLKGRYTISFLFTCNLTDGQEK